MLVFRIQMIFRIILVVSFACVYGLPSGNPPANDLLPPLTSRKIINSLGGFNISRAGCVADVGLKIGSFFIFNYISHAFTIKPGVGYKFIYGIIFTTAAFFLPYYGLLIACRGMESCAISSDNALKRAGRASALCVVARTKYWEPKEKDELWVWRTTRNSTARESPTERFENDCGIVNYAGMELEYLSQDHVQIHGLCHLPDVWGLKKDKEKELKSELKKLRNSKKSKEVKEEEEKKLKNELRGLKPEESRKPQYMLARLPPTYEVDWDRQIPSASALLPTDGEKTQEHAQPPDSETESQENRKIPLSQLSISSQHSIVRPVIALFQLLAAVPTIYQVHEAGSLENHGYAGYQLTVIPFALMSIINTCSNFATPSYGASYMVESSIMDEAKRRGGVFHGAVGRLVEVKKSVSLRSAVPGYGEIIGEVGKFEKDQDNKLYLKFEEQDIQLPTREKKEEKFFSITKKILHFAFRQHLWEVMREEFPVLRWFLLLHESRQLGKEIIEDNTPDSPAVAPREEQLTAAAQPNIQEMSQEQDADGITRLNPQQTSPQPPRPSLEEGSGEIIRLTPQRTCITRLFKRFSEKHLNLNVMILSPAFGNPQPREKSRREIFMFFFTDVILILSLAAPYIITYALTGYKAGKSTVLQRAIVILWLVMMQVACVPQRVIWNFLQTRLVPRGPKALNGGLWFVGITGLLWSIPGIISFGITMHQMVNDHRFDCDGQFARFVNFLGIGTGV